MTSKVYRTAQGKTVDLGTIVLKNEHVRAVGNMNVNARGDKLDQNNRVVETKPQQIQKQNVNFSDDDEIISYQKEKPVYYTDYKRAESLTNFNKLAMILGHHYKFKMGDSEEVCYFIGYCI